jgi:hypothetical protein
MDAAAKAVKAKTYIDYLRAEGWQPETDSDGDVYFKKEGYTYFLIVDADDDMFFQVLFPGFWAIESPAERQKALEACCFATSETKVAKAFIAKNDKVSVSVEVFMKSADQFSAVFNRCMSACQACVQRFIEKMKE